MTQLNRKDTVSYLVYAITSILGEDGIDVLGQYQLKDGTTLLGTVPSIQARHPRVTSKISKTIVANSGIEVVIESEPDMVLNRFKSGGSRQSNKFFQILLDQHDPYNGLTEALEALTTSSLLDLPETPVIREAQEITGDKGVLPPRAIIYHRQAHYKPVTLNG